MSKHHDWQMVKQIIATPNDQTDRYQCSKCGKIISAFACFQWLRTKGECQPNQRKRTARNNL